MSNDYYKAADVPSQVAPEYIRNEQSKIANTLRKSNKRAVALDGRVGDLEAARYAATTACTSDISLNTTAVTLLSLDLPAGGTFVVLGTADLWNNTSTAWTGSLYAELLEGSTTRSELNKYFVSVSYANCQLELHALMSGGSTASLVAFGTTGEVAVARSDDVGGYPRTRLTAFRVA